MRETNCLTVTKRGGGGERRAGQRRYAPKTRSGCITCKIRRVKCDEAKPKCKRCASTGRQCDGYAPVAPSKSGLEESPLTLALTVGGSSDALEHRTFEFFKTKTTPCIAGYFPDSVWDRTLLQASQSEPSIRFAVNALGALHEERFLRKAATKGGVDTSLVQTNFPANQYAKALKGLQDLLSSPNPRLNVVLLCSLVCIHFESLRANFLPALIHVEHAIQLLDSADGTEKIDPSLVRALMRADLQGSVYVGMRVPKLSYYTDSLDSDLPEAGFTDLLHARDYTDAWSCRLYHFLRSTADNYKFRNPGNVPIEAYSDAQELEKRFIEIDRLLYELMQRPTLKLSPREHFGMGMLRARTKVNRILAGGCLYSEATALDRFLDQFEEIYAICKYIMQSDRGDRRLFSVSFDEGLLHPLYFVVTNCRDSRLRHACMAMLKKLPALEGIWHVEAMTRAAESCIKFEEAMCEIKTPRCSDIPEWRRIHSAGFDGWSFPQSNIRTSVTAHFRVRPNGMDGDWMDVEQLIECNESSAKRPDLSFLPNSWVPELDKRPLAQIPVQDRLIYHN